MAQHIALVELHLHLEGSIYPSDAIILAKKHKTVFNFEAYHHLGFENFLKHFGSVVSLLKDEEDFALVLYNHLKRMKRWGVVYAEIRISPSVWEHYGLDVEKIARFIFSLNYQNFLKYNFIIEAVRHWDGKLLERDFNLALKYKDKVRAFGIGGNENIAPIKNFKFLFEECKKNGLKFIPHSGENSSAGEVIDAIELGAKRIGHGIRSSESIRAIKKIIERNVHLEICPTSNYATLAVEKNKIHPLNIFCEEGVSFSISTDDPGLFLTTMKKEMYITKKILKKGDEFIFKIQKEALKSSLLNKKEKDFFYTRFFS